MLHLYSDTLNQLPSDKQAMNKKAGPAASTARPAHKARAILCAGVLACLLMASLFMSACSSQSQDSSSTANQQINLTVASLKGPTSIGLASMMAGNAPSGAQYTFDVEASADAIIPKVVQGEVDIALVPANVASILYQKTSGGVTAIDINTLGVLYGVSQNSSFTTIESLRGATVYMTGKGTVPQYTLDALLSQAGMTEEDLTIEFKSEPAEVVAAIGQNAEALGILPQPYATASTLKNSSLKTVMSLTEQWDTTMGDDSGKLLTGVTIVRNDVLKNNPDAVEAFLKDHAASVETVKGDAASAAQQVVNAGILDDATLAEKAIPNCNLVCITGKEMKSDLSGYLQALYKIDPASIGGSLPGDDFYYVGK